MPCLTKIFQQQKQELNFDGDRGAIFKLWEDPGEQNNLIYEPAFEWVKIGAYKWMEQEFKGSRLPLHGSDNEAHTRFYKYNLLPTERWGKGPNPNNPIYK